MKCPICSHELENGLQECPFCGVPLKTEDGKYVESEEIAHGSIVKHDSQYYENLKYEKNNVLSGICAIGSFVFASVGIVFISIVFLLLYSIIPLTIGIALGAFAFFKSKESHFKAVNVLSIVSIAICGICIITAMSMIVYSLLLI